MNIPTYYRGAGILFCAPDQTRSIRVLLGKRLFCPFAGTWSVAGGRMESRDGGDFRRCAAREAFEETVGNPKLDSIRTKILHRLGRSPMCRLHVPFLFDFNVFLVPLSFMPDLDLWPSPAYGHGEFSEFGWFLMDHLPDPLHPHLAKTIKKLSQRTR